LPRRIHLENSLRDVKIEIAGFEAEINIPVVDDEVGKDELMRFEPERSEAKGKYGYPEIDRVVHLA
jgi:hypothetical protein